MGIRTLRARLVSVFRVVWSPFVSILPAPMALLRGMIASYLYRSMHARNYNGLLVLSVISGRARLARLKELASQVQGLYRAIVSCLEFR